MTQPESMGKMIPEDVTADVWVTANDEAVKYLDWLRPANPDIDAEYVLTRSFANLILAERDRCAQVLVRPDGYFNAPPGFYEALSVNTVADNDTGEIKRSGDTGNWASFFYEMLKPFATAIRKPTP